MNANWVGKWVGDYSASSNLTAVLRQWNQRSRPDLLVETQGVKADWATNRDLCTSAPLDPRG